MAGTIRVKVFSPKRNVAEDIETSATSWSELRDELSRKYGSSIAEMTAKAVTNKGQTVGLLEDTKFDGTEWDSFTLYLTASKVANG